MAVQQAYEVFENGRGWVLRRPDRIPIVEFPTRHQAIRAGIAVCMDEGRSILRVQGADGSVEEWDTTSGKPSGQEPTGEDLDRGTPGGTRRAGRVSRSAA